MYLKHNNWFKYLIIDYIEINMINILTITSICNKNVLSLMIREIKKIYGIWSVDDNRRGCAIFKSKEAHHLRVVKVGKNSGDQRNN